MTQLKKKKKKRKEKTQYVPADTYIICKLLWQDLSHIILATA